MLSSLHYSTLLLSELFFCTTKAWHIVTKTEGVFVSVCFWGLAKSLSDYLSQRCFKNLPSTSSSCSSFTAVPDVTDALWGVTELFFYIYISHPNLWKTEKTTLLLCSCFVSTVYSDKKVTLRRHLEVIWKPSLVLLVFLCVFDTDSDYICHVWDS